MIEQATVIFTTGTSRESVARLLGSLVPAGTPSDERVLVWREPVPQRTRIGKFQGLAAGTLVLGDETPLDEARLWWPGGGLHLVSNFYGAVEAGTRWCAFQEQNTGSVPPWIGEFLSSGETSPAQSLTRRGNGRASTLTDLARYGLDETADLGGRLQIVEYLREAELVCWRLEQAAG